MVFFFFRDRPRQAFHADAEPPAEAKITSATTFVYGGDIQVDVSKRKKRKRKDGGRRERKKKIFSSHLIRFEVAAN